MSQGEGVARRGEEPLRAIAHDVRSFHPGQVRNNWARVALATHDPQCA